MSCASLNFRRRDGSRLFRRLLVRVGYWATVNAIISAWATAASLPFAVEQRRRVFEVYLQELLCLQPRPVELNAFMDINQHVWGHDGDGSVFGPAGTGTGGAAVSGAGGSSARASGGPRTSAAPFASGSPSATNTEALVRLREGNVGVDDFELLRVLGKGSFGKVFLVRLLATGQVYAMKVLKKSEVVRRRQVEHVCLTRCRGGWRGKHVACSCPTIPVQTKAERRIMGGIDHPFIVSLRFAFHTVDKLYMVTDYCK